MNLFEQARKERLESDAPLAARMRPRVLDDFVGQEAIVGPGRLLRRAIQADQLSSLIFYGPPGTGKTTLAQVIANTTAAHDNSMCCNCYKNIGVEVTTGSTASASMGVLASIPILTVAFC